MSRPPDSDDTAPSTPTPSREDIAAALTSHWGLTGAEVAPLMGGMNSATWTVRRGATRWVAKTVPQGAEAKRFRYGLELSAKAEAAGVPSGAPVISGGGHMTRPVKGHALALLRWVEGRELDARDETDQKRMGTALARVHRVFGARPVERGYAAAQFELLAHYADEVVDSRPWIRSAVEAASERLRRLRPETLTWGPLHGDPAPEHFRFDSDTGLCGLIDWGAANVKPRLYDVATVVMDAGGPEGAGPLLRAYLAERALAADELERALTQLLDFRYAINALYYAERILRGDMTGVNDASGNEDRLEEAHRWLTRPAAGRRTARRPAGP